MGYRMSVSTEAAEELRRLAGDVLRLLPSHRDPEAFHVSKSEIAARLRRLAKAAEREREAA